VLGGARSGKSDFAQQLAVELAGDRVLFVATAQAGDAEMQRRIEKHRRARPAGWRTLEVQREVGPAIQVQAGDADVVLLDCLTLLVTNLLMDAEDPLAPEVEDRVVAEIDGLMTVAEQLAGHLIVISNEVGMGLVPAYPLGRTYRDLLGQANQMLARQADEVYFLVAGLPQKLKGG
jgi:adenosylcobinamide kinase/adenosylcobinamide-phosphate guanylyltransferase